jgi:hypothetical protein
MTCFRGAEPMFDRLFDEVLRYQQVTLKYFVAYSRFEYALKSAGYVTCSKKGLPGADWCAFSRDCPDLSAIKDVRFVWALEHLERAPPKKLFCTQLLLTWQSVQDQGANNEIICRKLGRARNNLFHGQKIPYDFERDESLLDACLCVLELLVEIGPLSVRQRFL